MKCCHGNGLNPKIDNQNINLISTVSILVNLYREINSVSFSNLRSIARVFVNALGSHLKKQALKTLWETLWEIMHRSRRAHTACFQGGETTTISCKRWIW